MKKGLRLWTTDNLDLWPLGERKQTHDMNPTCTWETWRQPRERSTRSKQLSPWARKHISKIRAAVETGICWAEKQRRGSCTKKELKKWEQRSLLSLWSDIKMYVSRVRFDKAWQRTATDGKMNRDTNTIHLWDEQTMEVTQGRWFLGFWPAGVEWLHWAPRN